MERIQEAIPKYPKTMFKRFTPKKPDIAVPEPSIDMEAEAAKAKEAKEKVEALKAEAAKKATEIAEVAKAKAEEAKRLAEQAKKDFESGKCMFWIQQRFPCCFSGAEAAKVGAVTDATDAAVDAFKK